MMRGRTSTASFSFCAQICSQQTIAKRHHSLQATAPTPCGSQKPRDGPATSALLGLRVLQREPGNSSAHPKS